MLLFAFVPTFTQNLKRLGASMVRDHQSSGFFVPVSGIEDGLDDPVHQFPLRRVEVLDVEVEAGAMLREFLEFKAWFKVSRRVFPEAMQSSSSSVSLFMSTGKTISCGGPKAQATNANCRRGLELVIQPRMISSMALTAWSLT